MNNFHPQWSLMSQLVLARISIHLLTQKLGETSSKRDSDELTPFVKICIELRINGLQPLEQDFLIDGSSSESAQKL